MAKIGKNMKVKEFENLYFENYTYLCRSIYRFVNDEDITKDIVQDVFVKYWQKVHELHIHDSPISYIRRACINQALNHLKQKERRETRENIYSEETGSSRISDRPDTKYAANEASENIQKAIELLPPACKNAFLLSRYEEKSYKEIASLLQISINTVEKHIGKALKILRDRILNS